MMRIAIAFAAATLAFASSAASRPAKKSAPVRRAAPRAVLANPVGREVKRVMKVPGAVCCDPYIGAISIDAETGRVFHSERADAPGQPASMTKLMTALLVADELEAGRMKLSDSITASALAARQQPSSVGLRQGQSMTVEDLMASIMVKSANDAAVALAEAVARSRRASGDAGGDSKQLVAEFVALMNAKAAELGMGATRFTSPNGLPPSKGEKRSADVSTAADIAKLARTIVKRPDILRYTAMARCTVKGGDGSEIQLYNHNPFLSGDRNVGRLKGCDGLKTGYTDAAGSSIALTAVRNGRRAIVVVLGSSSRELREAAASHLIEDALGSFEW